jgi:predicted ribosome quality control (RQC) complex YloA/Tae2 family protein
MYFDYFVAAALVDELNQELVGGRIQDILEIDGLSLGFEIYHQRMRHYLYLTADPDQPRVHLTDGKLRRGSERPSPLGLLLNRYVEGAKVMAVRQPPWERILLFDLVGAEGEYTLVMEPIERRANIVLVEDGTIRECIRRVSADENRVRQLMPGQPYYPPPPQTKLEPAQVTLEDLKGFLDKDIGAKTPQALTRGIHGLSPLLAREITFRATGKPNFPAADVSPRPLFEAYQKVIEPLLRHEWQPGTARTEISVTAYSVYPLRHVEGWRAETSISAAMMAFYGPLTGEHAYEAGKAPTRKQLLGAEKKLKGKLYSLQNQQRNEAEVEYMKQAGELLLAYQYDIQPGQAEFQAQYDPEAEPLTINVDPLLNPLENAQRYFEKYEKAKRSRAALPELILQTERELRYLGQLATDLDLAANWDEIAEVQEAMQAAGYWQGAKARRVAGGGKSGPMKVVTDDGTVIWVGRNSRQNEEVSFKKSSPDDLWLHVRGMPGAHVVIKTTGRPVAPEVVEQAASLAAYYSKARNETAAEVMVTECKHVRKIKGGKPGMVSVAKQTHPSIRAVPHPQPE